MCVVSCRRAATVLRVEGDTVRKQYDFSKAVRGAVLAVPVGTTRITIRLDDDAIAGNLPAAANGCAAVLTGQASTSTALGSTGAMKW